MIQSTPQSEPTIVASSMRSLAMAILAPFGVIALLASPLFIDAIRHAAGL
jgi:hypothetical protein